MKHNNIVKVKYEFLFYSNNIDRVVYFFEDNTSLVEDWNSPLSSPTWFYSAFKDTRNVIHRDIGPAYFGCSGAKYYYNHGIKF